LQLHAQTKNDVLTLGSFHFNFPNKDVVKIDVPDQIDVLEPTYQNEIQFIVGKLERFEPTIIVIECMPSEQKSIDSLYNLYLDNKYELRRPEHEQIGFRLAKKLGIKKLYCVDEWGDFNPQVDKVVFGKDSVEQKKFVQYYEKNSDADLKYNPDKVFKKKGILEELIRLNDPENIKKTLGNYLIGPFKY